MFPHNSGGARRLLTIEVVVVAPYFAWLIARLPTRPLEDFVPVVFIVFTALVYTIRALRHLERLEREHEQPTAVMAFLLQLAAVLPVMAWVTIGMVLVAYRH